MRASWQMGEIEKNEIEGGWGGGERTTERGDEDVLGKERSLQPTPSGS